MAQHGVGSSLVADRYASALHDLATERGAVDEVAGAFASFRKMLDQSPELRMLVKSPAISAAEQTKAMTALLAGANISGIAGNFLRLVAAKRRLYALPAIMDAYARLVDAAKGVVRAEATVAAPLAPEQTVALRQALASVAGGKQVNLDVKTDPAIIGGVIVKLGSRMVDASVKTKLNSIRTRMKEVG